jgi:2-dehydro-3-deoxyphosphogluconate aldolase/(4S)-4-hydroxy-2-oxoglutarate aldolase
MDVFNRFSHYKIIPVIVIEDVDGAQGLGSALLRGGLRLVEITFRTSCAAEVIHLLSRDFPDMLIGAGTVLSVEQAKNAIDSGARFIVSPGLNRSLVEYCLSLNIPVIPGIITPTDLQAAYDMGLDVVKFFPAETAGGIAYLKSIAEPFHQFKFIPTGGINQNNLIDYLHVKNVIACGGSWLAPKKLTKSCIS